ncbi:CST complex subunit STN1 [Cajanus cajan]|nr:CST complex subunit STN1 [Cajanus cajan]
MADELYADDVRCVLLLLNVVGGRCGGWCNTHVKLLAFDLLSLTQSPSFSRRGIPLSRVETLGSVTLRDLKPGLFLCFAIDDGTGCVPCLLWLNNRHSPSVTRRHRHDLAEHFAALLTLGFVGRVRGRLGCYKGAVQVTVSDVMLERDPNAEILHRVNCIFLARNCYNLLPSLSSSSAPPPPPPQMARS